MFEERQTFTIVGYNLERIRSFLAKKDPEKAGAKMPGSGRSGRSGRRLTPLHRGPRPATIHRLAEVNVSRPSAP
jgi:hypothetical protein